MTVPPVTTASGAFHCVRDGDPAVERSPVDAEERRRACLVATHEADDTFEVALLQRVHGPWREVAGAAERRPGHGIIRSVKTTSTSPVVGMVSARSTGRKSAALLACALALLVDEQLLIPQ